MKTILLLLLSSFHLYAAKELKVPIPVGKPDDVYLISNKFSKDTQQIIVYDPILKKVVLESPPGPYIREEFHDNYTDSTYYFSCDSFRKINWKDFSVELLGNYPNGALWKNCNKTAVPEANVVQSRWFDEGTHKLRFLVDSKDSATIFEVDSKTKKIKAIIQDKVWLQEGSEYKTYGEKLHAYMNYSDDYVPFRGYGLGSTTSSSFTSYDLIRATFKDEKRINPGMVSMDVTFLLPHGSEAKVKVNENGNIIGKDFVLITPDKKQEVHSIALGTVTVVGDILIVNSSNTTKGYLFDIKTGKIILEDKGQFAFNLNKTPHRILPKAKPPAKESVSLTDEMKKQLSSNKFKIHYECTEGNIDHLSFINRSDSKGCVKTVINFSDGKNQTFYNSSTESFSSFQITSFNHLTDSFISLNRSYYEGGAEIIVSLHGEHDVVEVRPNPEISYSPDKKLILFGGDIDDMGQIFETHELVRIQGNGELKRELSIRFHKKHMSDCDKVQCLYYPDREKSFLFNVKLVSNGVIVGEKRQPNGMKFSEKKELITITYDSKLRKWTTDWK